MGGSKNRGTPKWMVYNGKPYQNGWFGGTTISGNIHILTSGFKKEKVHKPWLNGLNLFIWYYLDGKDLGQSLRNKS